MTTKDTMGMYNFGDPCLPDSFWQKVSPCPMSGCWLWIGATSDAGYGNFHPPGSGKHGGTVHSHRACYQAFRGAMLNLRRIPGPKVVMNVGDSKAPGSPTAPPGGKP